MASNNKSDTKCTENNTKICLGKVLLEVSNMINSYSCVKKTINNAILQLNEVLTELSVYQPTDPISEVINDEYFNIIKDMRHKINGILHKKIIPDEEETLIFKCKCDTYCFHVYPFLAMHFLQETNCSHQLLYFRYDPSTTLYSNNSKVTIDAIPDGSTLYPVWYYLYNNQISQNYTYMIGLIGSITYSELLDYRVLLKDDICMQNRKSVEANGKYKFTYMKDTCVITLPDPNDPLNNISEKQQGVIDGFFSFTDSLDSYTTIEEGTIATNNTLVVLNKLYDLLCMFIKEFKKIKADLCCTC